MSEACCSSRIPLRQMVFWWAKKATEPTLLPTLPCCLLIRPVRCCLQMKSHRPANASRASTLPRAVRSGFGWLVDVSAALSSFAATQPSWAAPIHPPPQPRVIRPETISPWLLLSCPSRHAMTRETSPARPRWTLRWRSPPPGI